MGKNTNPNEGAGDKDAGAKGRPSDPGAVEKPAQTPTAESASELSDEELGNVSGGMNKHLSTCTY
jgi:hypothetical protein